ncbi:hypothetical protein, partial [Legionella sp.]|uniref:hypothetical protein n=1 Tax=Legionella sp. TaxID=459 RepID=UPI003CA1AB83
MKLMIILLCLFSERFLIHSVSYQRFYWFEDYYLFMKKVAEKNVFFTHSWALFALIVLPILFSTAFIYILLHGVFYGFMGLLLSIVLFFYCLGPQNVFYPVTYSENESANQLAGDYFARVNQQLFSVVFWYIIAGPIVVVAYRLIALCRNIAPISVQANEITDLLEWIPARLTVLLFLLVGNFQQGLQSFLRYFCAKPDLNNEMLRECGLLAARTNGTGTQEVSMPVAEE